MAPGARGEEGVCVGVCVRGGITKHPTTERHDADTLLPTPIWRLITPVSALPSNHPHLLPPLGNLDSFNPMCTRLPPPTAPHPTPLQATSGKWAGHCNSIPSFTAPWKSRSLQITVFMVPILHLYSPGIHIPCYQMSFNTTSFLASVIVCAKQDQALQPFFPLALPV